MLQNKKVYIVDDCPYFTKLFKKNLSKNGFTNIQTFRSGGDLLKNLNNNPDIIFLDYQLDDCTGKELLYKIKLHDPNIIVVIVSSQTSMDITVDLLNNCAFDYVIKDDHFIDKLATVFYKLVSFFSSIQHKSVPGFDNFSEKEHISIILNAQEKVRTEISNELHDNINQLLGSAKLYLEMGSKDSVDSGYFLNESKSILETAINEIRNMSHKLSAVFLQTEDLNIKLPALIKQLKVQECCVLDDVIEIENFNNYLTPSMQHDVLRILQEIINNSMKYSHAKNFMVQIKEYKKGLKIVLSDNGKGFDFEKVKSGIGLSNIFKRIANLSGTYELNTAEAQGCSWSISIPPLGNFSKNMEIQT